MKKLTIILAALSFVGSAFAVDIKEGSCCDKAKKAGKDCTHPCCVKAKADGKVCEKCNK